MRTKALGANQRIRIGGGYASELFTEMATIARILRTAGLTLEIEASTGDPKKIYLYAARRPITHNISTTTQTAPPEVTLAIPEVPAV